MLTVTVELSYAEHRRAVVALAGGRAAGRADLADALPVLFAGMGIATAVGVAAQGGDPLSLVAALGTVGAFGFGFAWVARQRRTVTYRFDAAGLARAHEGRERAAAWGEVQAEESREFFLFRLRDDAWYLPRRAVDEAGRARLREWMAAAGPAPSVDDERERDDSR